MTENKILHFKSLMKCLNTLEINADVIGLQTVFPQSQKPAMNLVVCMGKPNKSFFPNANFEHNDKILIIRTPYEQHFCTAQCIMPPIDLNYNSLLSKAQCTETKKRLFYLNAHIYSSIAILIDHQNSILIRQHFKGTTLLEQKHIEQPPHIDDALTFTSNLVAIFVDTYHQRLARPAQNLRVSTSRP